MLMQLGAALYRARRWVIVVAVVVLAGATLFDRGLFGTLQNGGFDVPGSPSVRAQTLLDARLHGEAPDVVILMRDDAGTVTDQAFARRATRLLAGLRARREIAAVTSYYSTHDPGFVSRDGHETFALVQFAAHDETTRERTYRALAPLFAAPDLHVLLGGRVLLGVDLNSQISADLVRAETVTLPISAVLLVIVFGGLVAASLPLLVGAAAILGAFAILSALAGLVGISVFAANVVTMMGLGLAIDYALFIVTRFREELATDERDVRGALQRTMATAGRTVLFSGLTVSISLLGLLLFPEVFLHSMGLGAIAAVVVAVVAALVILPALLALLGRRVNALSLRGRPARPDASVQSGAWYRLSEAVMRRPVAVALLVTGVLLVLGSPVVRASFSTTDVRILPPDQPARVVAAHLARDFRGQAGAQAVIAVQTRGDALAPDNIARLEAYVRAIWRVPGVTRVDSAMSAVPAPSGVAYAALYGQASARRAMAAAAAAAGFARGNTAKLVVWMQPASLSPAAERIVRQIRAIPAPGGLVPLVSGDTARQIDLFDNLQSTIPRALLIIAVAISVLFFVMTGSLVMPLKAIVLNILSLSATFGALVWIFQDGHLQRWLGFVPTGSLDATQPILIFALAFGLSMDYEVFLLTRIKEQFDATGNNRTAVAIGVQRTGRLITSAALLLAIVVGAFASSQIIVMKEVGVGLAIGVVVDATLVRALLVPAAMQFLGRWNWWAPRPLQRPLQALRGMTG